MSDERPTGVPADQLAVHVVLEGIERDRKLAALRAMATQTGGLIARIDPQIYAAQISEEAFIDAPIGAVVHAPDPASCTPRPPPD